MHVASFIKVGRGQQTYPKELGSQTIIFGPVFLWKINFYIESHPFSEYTLFGMGSWNPHELLAGNPHVL